MSKFLQRSFNNLLGTALQFFGLGLCVHDFWLECERISSPLRLHGFWVGTCLIISGWIILLIGDIIGENK